MCTALVPTYNTVRIMIQILSSIWQRAVLVIVIHLSKSKRVTTTAVNTEESNGPIKTRRKVHFYDIYTPLWGGQKGKLESHYYGGP